MSAFTTALGAQQQGAAEILEVRLSSLPPSISGVPPSSSPTRPPALMEKHHFQLPMAGCEGRDHRVRPDTL